MQTIQKSILSRVLCVSSIQQSGIGNLNKLLCKLKSLGHKLFLFLVSHRKQRREWQNKYFLLILWQISHLGKEIVNISTVQTPLVQTVFYIIQI